MKNLESKVELKGKTILEIGCGEGDMLKYMTQKYKVRYSFGIEPLLEGEYPDKVRNGSEEQGENWRICQGDAMDLKFPDNSFDIVVSVATFEHIPDLEKCLAEIKRVLKPGGIFYTEFGPIWSGVIGHHCYNWIKDEVLKVPAWGQLYMSKEEMHRYITEHYSKDDADKICHMIFEDNWINRIDIRTMKRIFENCGMEILELKENTLENRLGWIDGSNKSELSEEIIAKLSERYTPEELKVCSLNLCLKK